MPIARSNAGSHTRRARPRGFTLVELVIALTIMAILVTMSLPRFGRAIEQSRADFAVANLRAIWAAERLYWLENHAYTDKLTQETPKGLYELGLLDPAVLSTTGDYIYTITTSAGGVAFQATATRKAGAAWAGAFTIDQDGATDGAITSGVETPITSGFQ
jgi:prepilin-type N-terminal cleavage/methylation domain-containing protein